MDQLLRDFLNALSGASSQNRIIITLGGSAMTVLGIKQLTKDIDICVLARDVDVVDFASAYSKKTGVRVDVFVDGWVQPMHFPDIMARTLTVQSPFSNIDLFVMNVCDMILTKIDRWKERDIDDISVLLKTVGCQRSELENRYRFVLTNYKDPNRLPAFKNNYQEFRKLFWHLLK